MSSEGLTYSDVVTFSAEQKTSGWRRFLKMFGYGEVGVGLVFNSPVVLALGVLKLAAERFFKKK